MFNVDLALTSSSPVFVKRPERSVVVLCVRGAPVCFVWPLHSSGPWSAVSAATLEVVIWGLQRIGFPLEPCGWHCGLVSVSYRCGTGDPYRCPLRFNWTVTGSLCDCVCVCRVSVFHYPPLCVDKGWGVSMSSGFCDEDVKDKRAHFKNLLFSRLLAVHQVFEHWAVTDP